MRPARHGPDISTELPFHRAPNSSSSAEALSGGEDNYTGGIVSIKLWPGGIYTLGG